MANQNPLDAAKAQAILEAMREERCVRKLAAKRLHRSVSWLYAEIKRLRLRSKVRALEREVGRVTWAPGRPARK